MVDSVASDEAPDPSPSLPICDVLEVLIHENKTTTKEIIRPMIDCASKLGEIPPDAERILPRMPLHESRMKM